MTLRNQPVQVSCGFAENPSRYSWDHASAYNDDGYYLGSVADAQGNGLAPLNTNEYQAVRREARRLKEVQS